MLAHCHRFQKLISEVKVLYELLPSTHILVCFAVCDLYFAAGLRSAHFLS